MKTNPVRTLLLGLMLCTGICVSAQNELTQRELVKTVYFAIEDSSLVKDRYSDDDIVRKNFYALDSIDDLIRKFGDQNPRDRVFKCIRISSSTSPEGRKSLNDSLAIGRSAKVFEHLLNVNGDLYEQVIFSTRLSRDWNGFERQIDSGNYPKSYEIGRIVYGRDASLDRIPEEHPVFSDFRKAENKALWETVKRDYFPALRYARVEFLRDTIIPDADNVLAKPYDAVCFTEEIAAFDTITRNVEISYPKFWMALKTNLLFDAVGAFNGSIEVPVGQRWSLLGEVIWPWWLGTRDTWCEQLGLANLEARYWFNKQRGNGKKLDDRRTYNPLTGFFIGGTAGWGYYDFETHKNGYQGELVMAGITGGYALRLHKYWNLEFSLGLGYAYTKYRKYDALDVNGDRELIRVGKDKKHFVGPLKAQISISYLLTTKSKKTEKRNETIKVPKHVTRCY